MFSQACVKNSVHRGWGLCPSMHHRSHDQGVSVQGVSVQWVSIWGSQSGGSLSGVLCPGGSLSRWSLSSGSLSGGLCPEGLCPGVSVQGGLCPGGLCPGEFFVRETPRQRPPYGNERVVRIVLECILVTSIVISVSLT